MTNYRRGLRRLSPDLLSKAKEETATQITRIELTFLGTSAFCLLCLLSPDSALLGGNEKINVPFAGPVSFLGFMLLGPTILIILRIYLQIYVEHGNRLDRLIRPLRVVRAPTLVPFNNSLIHLFSGLSFYLLLPVAMILFAWKAAVFPNWGLGLLCVVAAVVTSHAMLPLWSVSWRSKALLSVGSAIVVGIAMHGSGFPSRQFSLHHANLSGLWLSQQDLSKINFGFADLSEANLNDANLSYSDLSDAKLSNAYLRGANLSNANLINANLSDADLGGMVQLGHAKLQAAILRNAKLDFADMRYANLNDADLTKAKLNKVNLSEAKLSANLSGAILREANLTHADLFEANLSDADLTNADLSDADLRAKNLRQEQLDVACGNANTKLPEHLKLTPKPCPAR